MLFLPPMMELPAYTTSPVVAIISETPAAAAVQALGRAHELLKADLQKVRNSARIMTSLNLAILLSAEERGENLDVTSLLAGIDAKIKFEQEAMAPLRRQLVETQGAARRMKVPGANQIGNFAIEMNKYLDDWMGDLANYRTEVQELARRSVGKTQVSKVDKATQEYRDAVNSVFGVLPTTEVELRPDYGGPFIKLNVALTPDLESDVPRLLDLENAVHAKVALTTPEMLGLVSISYAASST